MTDVPQNEGTPFLAYCDKHAYCLEVALKPERAEGYPPAVIFRAWRLVWVRAWKVLQTGGT